MSEGDRLAEGDSAGCAESQPAWKTAVGYLAGKGGAATVDSEQTREDWRAVFADIRGHIDQLERDVLEAEEAFEGVGGALYRTQPPMYRRLVVRWWKLRGGGRRVPILARVDGGAGGRIKLEPVGRRVHLRVDRGFGLCADLAKRAVRGYWAMAGLRQELSDQVADVRRVFARAGRGRRLAAVERVVAEMAEIRAEAEDRLEQVGYDVSKD